MKIRLANLHTATHGTVWIQTNYHIAPPFGPGTMDMRLSGRFAENLTVEECVAVLMEATAELKARIPGLREQRPDLDKADFIRRTKGHGCLWFKLRDKRS